MKKMLFIGALAVCMAALGRETWDSRLGMYAKETPVVGTHLLDPIRGQVMYANFPTATNVQDNAFADCKNLRIVWLDRFDDSEKLGFDVFLGCESLQTVYMTNIFAKAVIGQPDFPFGVPEKRRGMVLFRFKDSTYSAAGQNLVKPGSAVETR